MPRLGHDRAVYVFEAANMHSSWVGLVLSHFFRVQVSFLMPIGLVITFLLIVFFGAIFLLFGEDCYNADPFNFEQMVWLSSHTLTTVGYGSIYPTCAGGQIVVIVEQYVGLVMTAIIAALILLKFMEPVSAIRFAGSALVAVCEDDGSSQLHFRLANNTQYPLQNVHAEVRAQLKLGAHHQHGAQYLAARLPLRAHCRAVLFGGEHWQITHEIDTSSPLAEQVEVGQDHKGFLQADELEKAMNAVYWADLSIAAYDPVYRQEVRFHRRYFLQDIVSFAKWEGMTREETVSRRPDGSAERIRVVHDHKLLDKYVEHIPSKLAWERAERSSRIAEDANATL